MTKRKNQKKAKRKIPKFFFLLLLLLLLPLIFLFDGNQPLKQNGFAMGSPVSLTLYGKKKSDAAARILEEISKEETKYISRYQENSEIFALNSSGSATVSDHTAKILQTALTLAEDSDGAFDITIGKITALWDFDHGGKLPSPEQIAALLPSPGAEKTQMNGNQITLAEGQAIDLGAIGKGVACDDAFAILSEMKIRSAVVSVGGSVMTYGENPKKGSWKIGIRTPEADDASNVLVLSVDGNSFISTSGDYEKFFERNGRRYHHILSPQTGFPADSGLKSVTVVSPSGLVSDALSTACFILGKEKSINLLQKYRAEAIFIDRENHISTTGGLKDHLTLQNEHYQMS